MRARYFWSLVSKEADGCWRWTGRHSTSGGRFGRGGYGLYGGALAHRVSYRLLVGPIPKGMQLDHLCRTPECVNPAHLEVVTPQENTRRAKSDECKRGHKFTPENTRLYFSANRPGPRRICRSCERLRLAKAVPA